MALVAQENNNTYKVPEQAPQGVFRAYDIRGPVADDSITENVAYAIGLALGATVRDAGEKRVVVGRDGRLTSPELSKALIAGLRETGCSVVYIGIVPSPLTYFATYHLGIPSACMVTASHNPKHHNGFKMMVSGETISGDAVMALYHRIQQRRWSLGGELGAYEEASVDQAYDEAVMQRITLKRPLKVVVDAGNGAGSEVAPRLYEALGCEVIPLYCEIDGNFPNHHPDPLVPENCRDLQAAVLREKADCGLAFDGDADRVGVVTNEGEIIWPDQLMMWFVQSILEGHPGQHVVFDVKCSQNLAKVIEASGGKPEMWRTGHSLIKERALELNAPFAGEFSGHIFFFDDWYGFDDGVYVGARLLALLAESHENLHERLAHLPTSVNTPEVMCPVPESEKKPLMDALLSCDAMPHETQRITVDGLRVVFDDGWGLVRCSNTQAVITLRFEADDEAGLRRIQQSFKDVLLSVDPDLTLPF